MPFITNLHTAQQIPNRFAEPVGTALAHDGASPFLVTSGQVSRDVNFLSNNSVRMLRRRALGNVAMADNLGEDESHRHTRYWLR
jgi:hypothetical protein